MLTLKANAAAVRRAKLNGRNYLVAPMTMLVPGVLNGSKGPLFYPEEEVEGSVDYWNGMPIVDQHPADGTGQYISARDPDVLNRQGLGMVLRAQYRGKLTSEGWFDEERTRRINPSIYNDLVAGRPIELSTGLYTENSDESGFHQGRQYTGVARRYRPDHLAILPGGTGACSLADGCGVLINQEKQTGKTGEHTLSLNSLESTMTIKIDRKKAIEGLVSNCKCDKREQVLELNKLSDEQLAIISNAFPPAKGDEEEEVEDEGGEGGEGGEPAPKKKMACNKADVNKWLENAPAEIQRMVANQRKLEKTMKAKTISAIMANAGNVFTKEELATKTVEDLVKTAKLVAPTANTSYTSDDEDEDEGANFAANGFGAVTGNAGEQPNFEGGLTMPELDLSAK